MKVIGAGFGRTGTLSLQHALCMLGFGPCYHMTELMNRPEQIVYWKSAAAGKPVAWRDLFDNYQAGVDFPVSLVYRELLEVYPEAKVVLTVRDPEKWYQSTISTIYQSSYPTLVKKLGVFARLPFSKRLQQLLPISIFIESFIWQQKFGGRFKDKPYAIDVYHRHIDEVKEQVPAEQLLIFEVRDGWQPLCEFLNAPIPAESFPHVNSTEDFPDLTRKILRGDVVRPGSS